MRGISLDLRERIVKRYEATKNAKAVASYYEVSLRSVYRYVALSRRGEALEAQLPPGRLSLLKEHNLEGLIRKLVKDDPEASLSTYVNQVEEETGIRISNPSMCRILQKLELTRKKRLSSLKNEMSKHD